MLFKSTPEDSDKPDKFHTALSSEGYSVDTIPVITFKFCNLHFLEERLKDPSKYTGIVFTSQRCIQAIQNCVLQESCKPEWDSHLREVWSRKRIFCVGPATTEKALELFAPPSSDTPNIQNACKVETGNEATAESLANRIVEVLDESSEKHLAVLYPCGNLKRDALQNILTEGGVETHPLIVYETVENPDLKLILESKSNVLSDFTPFVFFSPSGINSTLPYWKPQICNGKRSLVALGPTTKAAILQIPDVDESNVCQCEAPTPQALIKLLKQNDCIKS